MYPVKSRVGHRILFRSERSVLFRSFKEHKVLLRSFVEFLAKEHRRLRSFFQYIYIDIYIDINIY